MVVPLVKLFLGLALLAGVGLCVMSLHTYRSWNEPGVTAFAVFLALFGIGIIIDGAVGILGPVFGLGQALWSPGGIIIWMVVVIPWTVFVLEYTGTYTEINWQFVLGLSVPAVGMLLLLFSRAFGIENPLLTIIGFLCLLYIMSLMIIGCYLVLRTSHRYGHLSVHQGASVAAVPVILFVVGNFSGLLIESSAIATGAGVFAASIVGCTAATALALYRYETFQSTPAAGTIGEQTIVRQTEDLMFVMDDQQRIIRLNETAADRLEVKKTEALGDPLVDLLGVTLEGLLEQETVELMTDEGNRQFDPIVSELTDQHGRELGHTLSLHDVTELELREQRLEVLNRVLRHNLRNQVEVIKSNAEFLSDRTADGYADSIIDSADRLTELGRSARAIDQVVSRPPSTAELDLGSAVREATRGLEENGVALSLSVPEDVRAVTDRQALLAAAESAIENAVSRAESSVSVTLEQCPEGFCLQIVDDGPGISDEELAAVAAGTETPLQHGTGLGLWQLKWAVTKLNGELSIQNERATTVEIIIPDQDR